MPNKISSSKLYILLGIIVIVWGLSWPISKIALQYIPAVWLAALRLASGCASAFLLLAVIRKLHCPRRQDLPIILVLGCLQMGLFMILINLGLHYVDAGRSAILVYTTPLWVLPLAILFFHETASWLKWLGFILGMIGVIILFSPSSIDWSNHHELFGNGVLLSAALCWAIAILCARNMHWTRPPLELLPWQLLVGAIPALLFAVYMEPHPLIQWNGISITSLTYAGVIATGFAYWGTLVLSKELPSITVSLSFLGVPVTGLILAVVLLHEPLTLSIVAAMICIISGLGCVTLGNTRKKLPPNAVVPE